MANDYFWRKIQLMLNWETHDQKLIASIIIWVIFWFLYGSLLIKNFLQEYYLCFQKLGALGEEQTSQLLETSLTILLMLLLQVTMLIVENSPYFEQLRRCIYFFWSRECGRKQVSALLTMPPGSPVFDPIKWGFSSAILQAKIAAECFAAMHSVPGKCPLLFTFKEGRERNTAAASSRRSTPTKVSTLILPPYKWVGICFAVSFEIHPISLQILLRYLCSTCYSARWDASVVGDTKMRRVRTYPRVTPCFPAEPSGFSAYLRIAVHLLDS